MAIDDEVCNDKLDDYDILNNEYEGLLVDFEKLLHKCTKYRKTIATLTLDLESVKHDYNEVSEHSMEYQNDINDARIELNDARTEIETLRLELENKDKALNESMNKNVALKLSNNEKLKHCSHDSSKHDNKQYRKKHAQITCYNYGRKRHISHCCSLNKKFSSTIKGFAFQKVFTY